MTLEQAWIWALGVAYLDAPFDVDFKFVIEADAEQLVECLKRRGFIDKPPRKAKPQKP